MGIIKILITLFVAGSSNLQQLRVNYFNAAQNKKQLPAFEKTIEAYQKKDHTYYCYLAACNSLRSNYASSLSLKLKFFKSCKTNLEKSFAMQESFDAHFIRFAVQSSVPDMLKYKDKIAEDKKYLLTKLKIIPTSEFKQQVITFLSKSKALDKTEKEQLDKL